MAVPLWLFHAESLKNTDFGGGVEQRNRKILIAQKNKKLYVKAVGIPVPVRVFRA